MKTLNTQISINKILAFVLIAVGALACTSANGEDNTFDENGANSSEYVPNVMNIDLIKHQCNENQIVDRELEVTIGWEDQQVDPEALGPIQVYFATQDGVDNVLILHENQISDAVYTIPASLGANHRNRDLVNVIHPTNIGVTVEVKDTRDPICKDVVL